MDAFENNIPDLNPSSAVWLGGEKLSEESGFLTGRVSEGSVIARGM
jgi:hypothetical protein